MMVLVLGTCFVFVLGITVVLGPQIGSITVKDLEFHSHENQQVVIFTLGKASDRQGFGSLVMCAIFLGLYYDKPQLSDSSFPRRQVIIHGTEQFRKYRWNHTHDMFYGFFQAQYNNNKDHNNNYVMKMVQNVSGLEMNCPFLYNEELSWTCQAISLHTHNTNPRSENGFFAFRGKGMEELQVPHPSPPTNNMTAWTTNTTQSLKIFSNMMDYTCRNLPRQRLHPGIQSQIDDILSTFWKTNTNSNYPQKIKLAFHIRRTDKIIDYKFNNYSYYTADQYIKTLLESSSYQSPNRDHHQDSDRAEESYCFVATDDYATINELQNALQQHEDFNCTLLTLTTPGYRPTRTATDLMLFLAQIQLLVQAEVFVGTFSSNIAALVALWRGCEYYYHSNNNKNNHQHQQQNLPANTKTDASVAMIPTTPNFDNKFHHYFQSYGVDVQDWFFL